MIKNLVEAINYDQSKLNEFYKIKGSKQDYSLRRMTIEDYKRICEFYSTYSEDIKNGSNKEFLYIPKDYEVIQTLESQDRAYVGIVDSKNEILGIAKLEEIKGKSAFFVIPSFEKGEKKKVFGYSGLLVKSSHRKLGIGKELTSRIGRILHRMGATGFYADCDFRNEKSFGTLSKTMDFIGFTDGRQGAKGEQTIYTTFYKSFNTENVIYEGGLTLDFSKATTFDDVAEILKNKMNEHGGYSTNVVEYGKGYNTIYVINNRIDTSKEKSILIKPKNMILPDNDDNKLQNKNDNNMIVLSRLGQQKGR